MHRAWSWTHENLQESTKVEMQKMHPHVRRLEEGLEKVCTDSKKRFKFKAYSPNEKFMAKDGLYVNTMKKMLTHNYTFKVLGNSNTCRKMELQSTNGVIEFMQDHAEKWTPPAPNGQIQS